MDTTSQIHKVAASAHVDDEVGNVRDLLVDEQVKIIVDEGKPVTVWEVATKLGDNHTEQASAILDGLTAEGILARFRAGLNNYYAPPKVALTGEEPALRAIISGSLKSLFLGCRYKAMGKLKGE